MWDQALRATPLPGAHVGPKISKNPGFRKDLEIQVDFYNVTVQNAFLSIEMFERDVSCVCRPRPQEASQTTVNCLFLGGVPSHSDLSSFSGGGRGIHPEYTLKAKSFACAWYRQHI